MKRLALGIVACLAAASAASVMNAQEPGPTITVQGHTFTELSLFQCNIGARDDQTTQFPPHKIVEQQKAAATGQR